MNNQEQYIQEDEIDLRELFQKIWTKKLFIVGFTITVTVLAGIYSFMKTPIYEATALVEIGSYKLDNNNNNNNIELLDNASQLSKKLNVLYIDMLKNQENRDASIDSISVPKGQNSFIEIKSLSISNELATKEINKIIDYIKAEHKNIMDDVRQRREFEIKNINTKIETIKNKEIKLLTEKIKLQETNLNDYKSQLKLMNNNISQIENKNPSLTALKLMEKRDLSSFVIQLEMQILEMKNQKDKLETTTINELEEQKSLLTSMLLPHNYKNSSIVGKIITNDYPVKPKKKLIVAVAFVTGFIISIFLVFLIDFFRNIKNED